MQKISIITACYNSEKYIEQTIQSVIDQTYKNIEYIIVDGGSTDSTLPILEKYRDSIQKIISEPDQGVYDAFNKGLELSTGDIIYFLGSDDYLTSETIIEEIVAIFQQNKQLEMVYGQIKAIDEVLNVIYETGCETKLDDLRKGLMLPHQGFFAKKHLYEQYQFFDLQYKVVSDFDVIIKMFKDYEKNSLFIKKPIAYFRLGGVSNSQYRVYREMEKITVKHFGESYVAYYTAKEFNAPFYKKWLQILLEAGTSIGKKLKEIRINKVAIFGTMETTRYLINDLNNAGVEIVALLDNNPLRVSNHIKGYPIYSPDWLGNNTDKIEAIILSFEGAYESQITEQLHKVCRDDGLQVFSWRELLF